MKIVPCGIDRRAWGGARSDYESDSSGVLAACHKSAIRKHLRDSGAGAVVAPEFMEKREPELVGIPG